MSAKFSLTVDDLMKTGWTVCGSGEARSTRTQNGLARFVRLRRGDKIVTLKSALDEESSSIEPFMLRGKK